MYLISEFSYSYSWVYMLCWTSWFFISILILHLDIFRECSVAINIIKSFYTNTVQFFTEIFTNFSIINIPEKYSSICCKSKTHEFIQMSTYFKGSFFQCAYQMNGRHGYLFLCRRETKKCFKIYVHLVWPSVSAAAARSLSLNSSILREKVPTKCFKFSSKNVCSASLKASISWILMTISDKKKNFLGEKNKNIFFSSKK